MRAWRFALTSALVLGTLAFIPWGGEGTDDQAISAIESLRPGYAPWRASLFEPSENAEKWLFVLQAAMGGAVLGWVLAKRRGS